jgi:5-methylcytosine-specific restriction enzyme subunit McrC
LSEDLGLALHPKVELSNLFRMLEYAYKLSSFEFLDDLFEARSLEVFYNRLARTLARQILNRARKGFYRAYVAKRERLPYVRGRLDVRGLAQRPWDVNLQCHYEEHTADVEDNQILAWILFVIARSGLLTENTSLMVRQAYRSLQGFVTLQPFGPSDCVGRPYTRLNDDYQRIHALCRFFLEHCGPSHEMGDRNMLPFLVNMARLYELFVAEWLGAHPRPSTEHVGGW